jgi:hypothetical protein
MRAVCPMSSRSKHVLSCVRDPTRMQKHVDWKSTRESLLVEAVLSEPTLSSHREPARGHQVVQVQGHDHGWTQSAGPHSFGAHPI